MEIITAKTAGFCFGVKRAMDMAVKAGMENDGCIYTYGPLIHNQEVVSELDSQGIHVLHEGEMPEDLTGATVIIRSHGVSKQVQEELCERGCHLVDATCPFVKKIHRIVSEKSAQGYRVIIAGNRNHPEVRGIIGWCSSDVRVVEKPEDLDDLPPEFLSRVCIVAQTTFNYNNFKLLLAKSKKIMYDRLVYNSICNATQERQVEARQIAASADVMLVVGDRHSSNTQKLYEICLQECRNTHFVETARDLDMCWFEGTKRVGITAGASTPHKIIEEVQKCQKILNRC